MINDCKNVSVAIVSSVFYSWLTSDVHFSECTHDSRGKIDYCSFPCLFIIYLFSMHRKYGTN